MAGYEPPERDKDPLCYGTSASIARGHLGGKGKDGSSKHIKGHTLPSSQRHSMH